MSEATPSRPSADRNLLYGMLALQMNFVGRDDLLAAMQAWVFAKTKPLGQILIEQDKLTPDTRRALDELVEQQLQLHGDDPPRSLAALAQDPNLNTTVPDVADSSLPSSLDAINDPLATADFRTVAASGSVRYQVLRPHAKGGLGEVFVALDREVHREVALKEMLPQHADDPTNRGRFLREAEITGGLEHPGIVPVYGLGQYADGRPFYTMRLIQGETLKDAIGRFHAGQPGLPLRGLLTRFVAVCNAVAYAHSRGVLHRDLKPANVMLGKFGETLVVDWGLAKAIGHDPSPSPGTGSGEPALRPHSGDSSSETRMGVALGTPAYMSPEQAAGRLDLLGPASDVYGLGAMLYTILTGQPPVRGGGVAEVLEKIRKGDLRLARQVQPSAPHALEAVCRKAMALRPEDRYATALELAAEVEHWLADEPVRAWPEPWTVRAGRWARRHRTTLAAVGVFLVSAVVALSLSTVLVWSEQRKTAEQKRVAEQNYELSRDLSFNVIKMMETSEAEIAAIPALHNSRKEILKAAAQAYRKHLEQEPHDPELRKRTAQVYRYTANVHRLTYEIEAADPLYKDSIRLYGGLAEQYPEEAVYRELLSETLRDFSKLQAKVGQLRQATETLQQAIAIAEKLLAEEPQRSSYRRKLANSLLSLSGIEQSRGMTEAGKTAEQAVQLFRELVALPRGERHPYDPVLLAAALNQAAVAERRSGREDTARSRHKEALSELQPLVAERRQGVNLVDVLHFRSWFLLEQCRTLLKFPTPEGQELAETNLGAVIEQWTRLANSYPKVPSYREMRGIAHQVRGEFRLGGQRYTEARTDLEESRQFLEVIVQESPRLPDCRGELGKTYLLLARLSHAEGNKAGADQWLEEAAKALRQTLNQSPDHTQAQGLLKEALAEKAE
jgi:serine/threonine-protein kinase